MKIIFLASCGIFTVIYTSVHLIHQSFIKTKTNSNYTKNSLKTLTNSSHWLNTSHPFSMALLHVNAGLSTKLLLCTLGATSTARLVDANQDSKSRSNCSFFKAATFEAPGGCTVSSCRAEARAHAPSQSLREKKEKVEATLRLSYPEKHARKSTMLPSHGDHKVHSNIKAARSSQKE